MGISGDSVIIGAPRQGGGGAAYIFARRAGLWALQARLDPLAVHSDFGWAVDIDGDRAIVGAPMAMGSEDPMGEAYVFVRNGSTWQLEDQLQGSGVTDFHYFGDKVAIEKDWAVAVAGWAFIHLFKREGSDWVEKQKILHTGRVVLSGDTLAASYFVGGGIGAVRVYVRSGDTWTQEAQLEPASSTTTSGHRRWTATRSWSERGGTTISAPRRDRCTCSCEPERSGRTRSSSTRPMADRDSASGVTSRCRGTRR